MFSADLSKEVLVLLDKAIHFLAVVVIERKGRIDVPQRELWIRRNDLVGCLSLFSPKDDVLHAYSRTGDPRVATTRARCDLDMFGRFHGLIVLRVTSMGQSVSLWCRFGQIGG